MSMTYYTKISTFRFYLNHIVSTYVRIIRGDSLSIPGKPADILLFKNIYSIQAVAKAALGSKNYWLDAG